MSRQHKSDKSLHEDNGNRGGEDRNILESINNKVRNLEEKIDKILETPSTPPCSDNTSSFYDKILEYKYHIGIAVIIFIILYMFEPWFVVIVDKIDKSKKIDKKNFIFWWFIFTMISLFAYYQYKLRYPVPVK